MKWTLLRYGGHDIPVRPCFCPPQFVGIRKAYMKKVYDADPSNESQTDSAHFDFGGMIHLKDPIAEVVLGGGRKFTCFVHHALDVIDELKDAIEKGPKQQDGKFYRIATWPGSLIFLSGTDIKKIIKALKVHSDPTIGMLHTQAMKEALVEAAMVNRPPAEEPAIRKLPKAKEVN